MIRKDTLLSKHQDERLQTISHFIFILVPIIDSCKREYCPDTTEYILFNRTNAKKLQHRSNVKRYYELIQLDQAGIVSHIPAQIDPVWGKYKKPKQLPDHGKLPPSLLPPPATSNLTPTYQWGDQHEYIHKVQSRLYN
ncbi:hypothetical protein BDEG_26423 [Batrachochytrium dendrobatidis JEL423]|uniref:Uncharacterized protein n=1 Tax=Batrachochytrium dendrobatidis (strain JEL423) TaxID=403673 RepID=A0A177WSE9_BATDL|nr:hypothetical protein BDEG_26423 [Batrachochytrium dendrobatidis JEL423]